MRTDTIPFFDMPWLMTKLLRPPERRANGVPSRYHPRYSDAWGSVAADAPKAMRMGSRKMRKTGVSMADEMRSR